MAMNINPAYFWLFCGLATAGGVGYILYDQNNQPTVPLEEAKLEQPASAPQQPAAPKASDGAQTPEVQTDAAKPEETASAPEKEASPAPAFDILRVETDGSAVVAGSALPNSMVEIVDGETVIARAKTGSSGDFAIVLDEPLKPGPHELVIRSTPENGETVHSLESGIINIPESGNDLIAMVTKPGEPSRIIQKPEPEPAAPESLETEPETPTVSIEEDAQDPSQTPKDETEVTETGEPDAETRQEPQTAELTPEPDPQQPDQSQTEDQAAIADLDQADELQKPEDDTAIQSEGEDQQQEIAKLEDPADPQRETPQITPEAEPQPDSATDQSDREPETPQIPVLIEAAEVEGDKIFIAGTGQPGAVVNIYMEGQYKGSAVVGEEGAFLFEGSGGLAAGRYAVRADMLAANSAQVVARAEVSLLHKPEEIEAEKPVDVATSDEGRVEEPAQASKPAERTDGEAQSATVAQDPQQTNGQSEVAASDTPAQDPKPAVQPQADTATQQTTEQPAEIAQLPKAETEPQSDPEKPVSAQPDAESTSSAEPTEAPAQADPADQTADTRPTVAPSDSSKAEEAKSQEPVKQPVEPSPSKQADSQTPKPAEPSVSEPSDSGEQPASSDQPVLPAETQQAEVKQPSAEPTRQSGEQTARSQPTPSDQTSTAETQTKVAQPETSPEAPAKVTSEAASESVEVAKVDPKPETATGAQKPATPTKDQTRMADQPRTAPAQGQGDTAGEAVSQETQAAAKPDSKAPEEPSRLAAVAEETDPAADPKSPPADPKVEGLAKPADGELTEKKVQDEADVEIVKADRKPIAMAPLNVEGQNTLSEVEQGELPATKSGIKEIVTGSSVIIRRGDNLWRVSRRKWGQGIRYTVIFEANRDQIRDPHWIYPGQVFKIPETDEKKKSAGNSG